MNVEEAKQRLRVKAAEARRRALEYDGDPIEDLRHVLPDDFPAELWQKIIDGEYEYDNYECEEEKKMSSSIAEIEDMVAGPELNVLFATKVLGCNAVLKNMGWDEDGGPCWAFCRCEDPDAQVWHRDWNSHHGTMMDWSSDWAAMGEVIARMPYPIMLKRETLSEGVAGKYAGLWVGGLDYVGGSLQTVVTGTTAPIAVVKLLLTAVDRFPGFPDDMRSQ